MNVESRLSHLEQRLVNPRTGQLCADEPRIKTDLVACAALFTRFVEQAAPPNPETVKEFERAVIAMRERNKKGF